MVGIPCRTINCRCCSNQKVPELGYTICEKRKGIVPETLRPVLENGRIRKIGTAEEFLASGDRDVREFLDRHVPSAQQAEAEAVVGGWQLARVLRALAAGEPVTITRLADLGVPSYLIDDASGLDPAWVKGARAVGLTAGASARASAWRSSRSARWRFPSTISLATIRSVVRFAGTVS